MRPYSSFCIVMDSNGFLWVLVGPYLSLWIVMGPYWSLCDLSVLMYYNGSLRVVI